MHDAKGRPMTAGDKVLIPAVVASTTSGEEYCNVSVETVCGRRPDGMKEHFGAINTGVMFRANEGDDNADIITIEQPAPLASSGETG